MSLNARILVVDDDRSQRTQLAGFLEDLGEEVFQAQDGKEALALVLQIGPDVVLTDLRMPQMDGRELLGALRELNPEIGVIMITAHGAVEGAVGCLKEGASDYLLKPLDLDEVEHVVRRAVNQRHLERENAELGRRLGGLESVEGIVTAGGAMDEVLSMVKRIFSSLVAVLITGESGTGKELIARAIHAASPRSAGPFVAVNASALSSSLLESELFGHENGSFTGADSARMGRFEAAGGGTLFLDEIGDLPAEIQVKLLRVLQEKAIERVGSNQAIPIDVRVLSATHRDLAEEIREGRFREDLYYRLAVVTVDIPPLRRRRGDIPLLIQHFMEKYAQTSAEVLSTVSREAMDLLVRHDYPGNVRELENIVQRGMVLARGSQITTDDLPAIVLGARAEGQAGGYEGAEGSLPERVALLEKSAILEALTEENGNQTRAAGRLGISERALRYKLAKIREAG